MAVTVQVEGLEEINRNLLDLGDKLAKQYIRKAAKQASDLFVKAAKQRAPVLQKPTRQRQPGTLRDSIIAKVSLTKKKGLVVRVGPEKKVFYARFVEFGTSKMKPHPYMRPAWDSEKNAALDAFAESLKQSVASYKPK
jgi:HK97 gp10 family phage protein